MILYYRYFENDLKIHYLKESGCKKTPLEVFLAKMLFRYPPDDQKILSGFTGHIFSGFSVGDVFPGLCITREKVPMN